MTERTDLRAAVIEANPVPDPATTAAQLDIGRSLLALIDERSEDMTTTIPRVAPPDPGRRRTRRAAMAFAGAFVIVLLVVGAVALLGGGTEPTVTEAPPATQAPPVTTVAPPTTGAPSTAAPTTAAPTTTIAAAPAPMEWTRTSLEDTWIDAVVAGGPGLIAVGASSDGAAIWTSPDGLSWTSVPDDAGVFAGDLWLSDIAAGPAGFVAVGVEGRKAAAWVSANGLDWARVPDSPAFIGQGFVQVFDVTHGPAGYIAVGYDTPPDNNALVDAGFVLLSADGLTWERMDLDETAGAWAEGVAVWGDRYVAVGVDWSPAPIHAGVWTSTDGRAWTQVDVDHGDGGAVMRALGMSDDRMVAGGEFMPDLAIPESEACWGIALWQSDDPATWYRVPHDPDVVCAEGGAFVSDVAVSGDSIVAVGGSKLKDSPVIAEVGTVWVSADGGSTWYVISGPEDVFGNGQGFEDDGVELTTIVARDEAFLAYGSFAGEASVWIGTWSPDFGG